MAQEGKEKLASMLRRGGAESIVFLHGLGASKRSFKPCFELDSFKDYTWAVGQDVFSGMVLVTAFTCLFSPLLIRGISTRWPVHSQGNG